MSAVISRKRARKLIQQMRGRRIGVLGDWMLDRYVWGTANRISPEAAVPVVEFIKQSECLGGAGNVAANLAALGARVEAFGVIGNDEAGEALGKCLHDLRLPEKGILKVPSRPTTLKTRIIARHQQVVRVDREVRSPLPEKIELQLLRSVLAVLARLDGLVISDYDKGVVSDSLAERVLEASARGKVPVFIKPKWSRLPKYRGATVVVVNRKEAEFLVRSTLETEEAVEAAGRALLEHFVCAAVVITRGQNGLSLFEHNQAKAFHVAASNKELPMGVIGLSPARELRPGRQVYDRTGAGDTVLATMALASAAGATLREAALLGNTAAGVVVAKLGTATLTREELAAMLGEVAGRT